jgi:hypothetical protein
LRFWSSASFSALGQYWSSGFLSRRGCLLDCLPIFLKERLQLVALLRVLFAQPNHFSNDFDVEPVALGLLVNFFLGLGKRLDLLFDVLNALDDDSMRS